MSKCAPTTSGTGGCPGGAVGPGATTMPRNVTLTCSPGRVPWSTMARFGLAVRVGVGVGLGEGRTIVGGTNDGTTRDGWGIDTDGAAHVSPHESREFWY